MTEIQIPELFIAHSVGIESGMTLEDNIRSLEAQRVRNPDGLFYWGLGSAPAKGTIEKMLREIGQIKVLFYPVVSAPRPIDSEGLKDKEKSVKIWTRPSTWEGLDYQLPPEAQVVSHSGDKQGGHYAFVCKSPTPLRVDHNGPYFYRNQLRTFPCRKPLGQASAYAVRYDASEKPIGSKYQMIMEAELVPPYVLRFNQDHSKVIKSIIDWETGKYPV